MGLVRTDTDKTERPPSPQAACERAAQENLFKAGFPGTLADLNRAIDSMCTQPQSSPLDLGLPSVTIDHGPPRGTEGKVDQPPPAATRNQSAEK